MKYPLELADLLQLSEQLLRLSRADMDKTNAPHEQVDLACEMSDFVIESSLDLRTNQYCRVN
jgi:hypothetical protein